ncbi:MAG TPA: DUF3592 domain-containing protein [Acidobacteriaceae bacterium]|nr:DUF3592 domain-containing protein [Acidobacteriaceae bacterium]
MNAAVASNADPIGYWLHVLKYPIVLVVSLIVGAVQSWRKKRREKIAESWAPIEATIQFTSVDSVTDTDYFRATLEYSYFVGEYRSGKYTQDFDSEQAASNFTQAMKDKKVQVRYNPSKPDKSLLEDSAVEQALPPASPSILDAPSIL